MIFLRLVFFGILLFSLQPSIGMAAAKPIQAPLSQAILQQTNRDLLTQELLSLTQKLVHTQQAMLNVVSVIQQRFVELLRQLQDITFRLVWSLLLLFFLLLCLFQEEEPKQSLKTCQPIPSSKKTPPRLSEENDIRDEYDFMATEQAIPAKLDLARAYIDMGDSDAAKAVLQDVILNGDKPQIERAKELLFSL